MKQLERRQQMGDAVPQTPWDFPHGPKLKETGENDHALTRPRSLSLPVAWRSSCIPAALYPPMQQTVKVRLDKHAIMNY
jgi:hypothetical protein